MDPRDPRSTVLTPAEEAIIVAFGQRALLLLDEVVHIDSCEVRHADGELHIFLVGEFIR